MAHPTQNLPGVPDPNPKPLKSGLYLVATPIGNLGDITLRGLEVLREADLIACEDTRVSGRLLAAYGIRKPLFLYHDHNADEQRPKLIDKIREGQSVALISDAGMPLVSDPGHKLVRACQESGLAVTSIPGASAPLMALQLSGLPSDAFLFAGFLPTRKAARRDELEKWKTVPASLIFFESANRLEAMLADLMDVMGDRQSAVTRELTKLYEEVWSGTVSSHLERVRQNGPPKGEIVVVVGGYEAGQEQTDLDSLLTRELSVASLKDAVQAVSEMTGVSRKIVYAHALRLRS